VVNLAGETIGGTNLGQVFFQRWSTAKKRRILESRTDAGQALMQAIETASHKPATLLQMSAVGYYGPRPDRDLDERASPATDFLATVCVAWERSTEPPKRWGAAIVVRTGLSSARAADCSPSSSCPSACSSAAAGGGDQGFS
jgi:NAD dependent epimerase/dehydratase family enzyme